MIRILIVDDSALMRKLMAEIFSAKDEFETAYARTGLEALEKLAAFKPDVITLDVTMPVMDGLACLDRIMLERPTPVVMVSSLTAAGAEATLQAFRLGAVDVVAKPTGAVSLGVHDMAATLIEKVRAAASARLPTSLRLTDRVRHRAGAAISRTSADASSISRRRPSVNLPRLAGDGLVLIGTSTGGPPALETVLTGLPERFTWPIVVAQHMPALFTRALAKRLDSLCKLTVIEVAGPVNLEAGHVYIARGDADIVISRRAGAIIAMPAAPAPDYLWRPSVDRMVRSAMGQVSAHQLVGVLMTGMGNDGAAVMAALRVAGGRTIAESEESAIVWGMPGELVRAGGADWVVPVQEIGDILIRAVPRCL